MSFGFGAGTLNMNFSAGASMLAGLAASSNNIDFSNAIPETLTYYNNPWQGMSANDVLNIVPDLIGAVFNAPGLQLMPVAGVGEIESGMQTLAGWNVAGAWGMVDDTYTMNISLLVKNPGGTFQGLSDAFVAQAQAAGASSISVTGSMITDAQLGGWPTFDSR